MVVLIVYFGEDVLPEAPPADRTLNLVRFVALGLLTCYDLIGRRKLIFSMLLLDSLCEVPLSQVYNGLFVFVECDLTNLLGGALLSQLGYAGDHGRRSH